MGTFLRLFLAVIALLGLQAGQWFHISQAYQAIIIPTNTPTQSVYFPPIQLTPIIRPIITSTPTIYYPPRITPTYTLPSPPTATFTSTALPTFTPTSTATSTVTFTPTPTSTETPTLLPPEAKTLNQACTSYVGDIISQALGIPDLQFPTDLVPSLLAGVPGEQTCGQDAACWNALLLKSLSRGLIEAGFESSPGPRPAEQVIGAMSRLFDEPTARANCQNPGIIAWEIALQFSIKGVAIDAYAVHSPAHIRVRDFEAKETGFKNDGSIPQDIPGSLARKEGEGEYIFVPGEKVSVVEIEGTSEGQADIEAISNTQQVVRDMSFDDVPVNNQTRGTLDLQASRPSLQIQAGESSQLTSISPTTYQEFQIQASVAPVTATPSITSTITPSPSPTPGWQALLEPQFLSGVFVICVIGFSVAALTVIVLLAVYPRKRSKRRKK